MPTQPGLEYGCWPDRTYLDQGTFAKLVIQEYTSSGKVVELTTVSLPENTRTT
jgi:hypothetical protein